MPRTIESQPYLVKNLYQEEKRLASAVYRGSSDGGLFRLR
jgi:hypothetical protein